MKRGEALELVHQLMKNKNLIKHLLAVEAVMRALARHFGEDEETWGLVGLLHDADYEVTQKDMARHTLVIGEMLEERGVDPVIVRAIRSHSDEHGVTSRHTGIVLNADSNRNVSVSARQVTSRHTGIVLNADSNRNVSVSARQVTRQSKLEKALYASDDLTGLIVAAALIHPAKKLNSIDATFVLHRFKERAFARGADRERIKTCSGLGLELKEFVEICLSAMQGISDELGL